MCTDHESYMSPAACEIMNIPQKITCLQVITEHDYNYIKLRESMITITIMITQKM